jgi:uncharacterized protein (UPF0335 family)
MARRDDDDLVGEGGNGRGIKKGDNSRSGSDAHGVARDQLLSFVERIERLEEEKKTIADDIKDVYGEAKGTGFDAKILKKVIAIRKQDKDERMEQEAILDTYLAALGMIEAPERD